MSSLRIDPPRPYSLSRTTGAFARFPEESVDIVVPGGYRRAFDVDGVPVLVEATQDESGAAGSAVEIQVLSPERLANVQATGAMTQMRRVIALDETIDEVIQLLRNDERVSGLAPHLTGLRRTVDPTPFEGLVSSIIAQLISISGAATVRARLVRHFGYAIEYRDSEYWVFPDPAAVVDSTVDELCSLKMTSAKARAILAVARAAMDGELALDQLRCHSDREIIAHLTSLPGVGPWTAEWFLVNVMGRMSVVPAGDLGIRRSTGDWLLDGEMPSPEMVREVYDPFGDQRAYVAYYVLSAERFGISPGDLGSNA